MFCALLNGFSLILPLETGAGFAFWSLNEVNPTDHLFPHEVTTGPSLWGGSGGGQLADRLYMLIGRYGVQPRDGYEMGADAINWSEQDVVLIAYGDMISRERAKSR